MSAEQTNLTPAEQIRVDFREFVARLCDKFGKNWISIPYIKVESSNPTKGYYYVGFDGFDILVLVVEGQTDYPGDRAWREKAKPYCELENRVLCAIAPSLTNLVTEIKNQQHLTIQAQDGIRLALLATKDK